MLICLLNFREQWTSFHFVQEAGLRLDATILLKTVFAMFKVNFLMVCDLFCFGVFMFISCISIFTGNNFQIAVWCQILCTVSSGAKSKQNDFCSCWILENIFFKITWVYFKKKKKEKYQECLHRNNKTLWKLLVYFMWHAYPWSCWKGNKSESVSFSNKQKII